MSDKNSLRNFHHPKKNLAPPGDGSKLRNSFFLMAVSKKLSGRPEMKEGKRVRKIDARFTQDEYDMVLAMEREFGIRKTDLVRMRLLQDAHKIVVNGAELILELDRIGAELGRSGNNINQLARHANSLKLSGSLSPQVVTNFNRLLEGYIANQRLLEISLRKIIRLMGK